MSKTYRLIPRMLMMLHSNGIIDCSVCGQMFQVEEEVYVSHTGKPKHKACIERMWQE